MIGVPISESNLGAWLQSYRALKVYVEVKNDGLFLLGSRFQFEGRKKKAGESEG